MKKYYHDGQKERGLWFMFRARKNRANPRPDVITAETAHIFSFVQARKSIPPLSPIYSFLDPWKLCVICDCDCDDRNVPTVACDKAANL